MSGSTANSSATIPPYLMPDEMNLVPVRLVQQRQQGCRRSGKVIRPAEHFSRNPVCSGAALYFMEKLLICGIQL